MSPDDHFKHLYKSKGRRDAKKRILDLLASVGERGIFQAQIPQNLILSTTYISTLLNELEKEGRIIKRKEIGRSNRIWLVNKTPEEESVRKIDTKTHLYPIYLGFVPATEFAALFLAEDSILKKYDIHLKLIPFQNVEEATLATGRGALDLCVTPVITQIAVALRTGSLKIIAGAGREGSAIVIRKDLYCNNICDIKDLREKKIGSSRLSAMEMNLRTILEKNGIDSYEACKIIFYESPELMYQALKYGHIDAISIWEPYITKLESEDLGKTLLWYSDHLPQLPCCTLAANTNFLERNAWLIDRFMKGYIEAYEKIAKNRDMAIKYVAYKLKTDEKLIKKGFDNFIYSPFISKNDITDVIRRYRLRLVSESEVQKLLLS